MDSRFSVLAFVAACGSPSSATSGDDGAASPDASVSSPDAAEIDATAATPHGYVGAYKSPTIVRVGSTYHAYFAADRVAGAHRNILHATFTADGNWHFEGE